MNIDERGEMSFMEAMVSAITVVTVIGLYLAFVATTNVYVYDPLADFDSNSLEIDMSEGDCSISESYLYMFLLNKDLYGIEVSVRAPFFMESERMFLIGDSEGLVSERTYVRMASFDNGRSVPMILEVVAYG